MFLGVRGTHSSEIKAVLSSTQAGQGRAHLPQKECAAEVCVCGGAVIGFNWYLVFLRACELVIVFEWVFKDIHHLSVLCHGSPDRIPLLYSHHRVEVQLCLHAY